MSGSTRRIPRRIGLSMEGLGESPGTELLVDRGG